MKTELTQSEINSLKDAPLIKAGNTVVLINGQPPLVDCRVISDAYYQKILSLLTKQDEYVDTTHLKDDPNIN